MKTGSVQSVLAAALLAGLVLIHGAMDSARAGNRGPRHVVPASPASAAADAGEAADIGILTTLAGDPGGPLIPVQGVSAADLRNSFGQPRADGRSHTGIDIDAPRGTPLGAAVDGWVVALPSGGAGGLGLHLIDRTGTFLLYYGHLDTYAEPMWIGRAVRRGELLGYVGTTGNAAGPHLHLEVGRLTSPGSYTVVPINPYDFLTGARKSP
jgi:peptidoglycan LD-endopeptidase LytH